MKRFVWLAGNLALDLVNTVVLRDGERVDLLQGPNDVVAWLREAAQTYPELQSNARAATERDVLAARELRQSMQTMAEALIADKPVGAKVIAAVNRILLQTGRVSQVVRRQGRYSLVWEAAYGPESPWLSAVAEAAAWLLTEGDRRRVRKCGNPDCILYMYDTTKSRTRQWCAMSTCGNRMKAAAFYQRKRAAARP